MCAQEVAEPRSLGSWIGASLTWLGGGHRREPDQRRERSTHAPEAGAAEAGAPGAGAVVLVGAVLAWLVAALAVSESTRWSMPAIVPVTLVFALLVGAVTRGVAGAPRRGRSQIAGRAAVAIAVGIVVGELAALVLFSSSIDRRLDERALRNADSAPAVAQASAALQQTRDARGRLDTAVAQARQRQDQALVTARCEYHPTPGCPQTRITGDPGTGPESRTANEVLADAQRELDDALAARDRQAPELDANIARDEQALDKARHDVVADAGRGLGARWVAMNDLTFAAGGAWVLRLLTTAFFVLLYLLPLIMRLWRGETTHDRHATAHAERERAELNAETAIAIKRAEVRREAETMWAEHQLTQARLAIEAQTEIDREHQRRRVTEALEGPVRTSSQRTFDPVDEAVEDDMYLPIAAEAEAASRAITQFPAGTHAGPDVDASEEHATNLPAPAQPSGQVAPHAERATPLIPSIPDATKAAARWIRPLVPPFVARVIDTTAQPLRTARQVFEEVEEITFSLKRHRKVTVDSESSEPAETAPRHTVAAETPSATGWIASSRQQPGHQTDYRPSHQLASQARHSSPAPLAAKDIDELSLGVAQHDRRPELTEREGPRELRPPQGPRQLPPARDPE